jgi:hypothetical protein
MSVVICHKNVKVCCYRICAHVEIQREIKKTVIFGK